MFNSYLIQSTGTQHKNPTFCLPMPHPSAPHNQTQAGWSDPLFLNLALYTFVARFQKPLDNQDATPNQIQFAELFARSEATNNGHEVEACQQQLEQEVSHVAPHFNLRDHKPSDAVRGAEGHSKGASQTLCESVEKASPENKSDVS